MAKPSRKKTASSDKQINCKITAVHGYLNDDKTKVAATVSWNDRPPKFNIRDCFMDDNNSLQLRKGIALDPNEIDRLTDILNEYRRTGSFPKVTESGQPIINFNEIFSEAEGIVEAREEGHTTKDGFILLRKRPGVKLWTEKKS